MDKYLHAYPWTGAMTHKGHTLGISETMRSLLAARFPFGTGNRESLAGKPLKLETSPAPIFTRP